MGSLRRRLLRLEHHVAAPVVEATPEPISVEERAYRINYWLARDYGSLSPDDKWRVDVIRQAVDRARRRQASA